MDTQVQSCGPDECFVVHPGFDNCPNCDLLTAARIVPAFKDGMAIGFKLFAIEPDSLYAKLGFRNGDIVSKVGGGSIDTPEAALEVYTRLNHASMIEVDIIRRGGVVKHRYFIAR